MKRWIPGALLAVAVVFPCMADAVDVAPYAKNDSVATIKLSPNGMEKARRAAGVPVETLFSRTEGDGFFVEDHKKRFFNQLPGLLDKNIGSGANAASATAAGAAGK